MVNGSTPAKAKAFARRSLREGYLDDEDAKLELKVVSVDEERRIRQAMEATDS